MGPQTLIPGNNMADELASRGMLLLLSAVPSGLSHFSSIGTLFFCWIVSVLFYLNSLTHRSAQYPLKNLCFLVMLAVSCSVFTATNTAFC